MTEDSTIAVTKTTIRIFVAINQDGDFYVDRDCVVDAVDGLRGYWDCEAVRTIELAVTVDLPTTEIIPVTVPVLTQAPAEVSVS